MIKYVVKPQESIIDIKFIWQNNLYDKIYKPYILLNICKKKKKALKQK